MSRTRYEWSVADFAILAIGAVTVPIYETSSAEQVEWILADSGAKAIFVETDKHLDIVESVRGSAPDLGPVWVFDDDGIATVQTLGATVAARAGPRSSGRGPVDLIWPRSSTPRARPAGRRAASSPTPTSAVR